MDRDVFPMIDRYTGEIVWQARSSTGNELLRESLRRIGRSGVGISGEIG